LVIPPVPVPIIELIEVSFAPSTVSVKPEPVIVLPDSRIALAPDVEAPFALIVASAPNIIEPLYCEAVVEVLVVLLTNAPPAPAAPVPLIVRALVVVITFPSISRVAPDDTVTPDEEPKAPAAPIFNVPALTDTEPVNELVLLEVEALAEVDHKLPS
jgi:hypothetical protein